MKKKIILLCSLLVFLTGCEANYNLTIEDENFYTEVEGKFNPNKYDATELASLDEFATLGVNAFVDDEEEKMIYSIDDSGKNTEFTFKYDYTAYNFDNSYLINNCFSKHEFINDDDFYYIYLLGDFGCQYADEVNININTNYAVIDTDATKKGNTYTWTINNSNNKDVEHYIKIAKIELSENKTSGISKFRIVAFVILIVISIVTYLLYRKNSSDGI